MKDLISRQRVLKLLSTMPPEEAMTKTLLIQSVKQMDAPDNLVKDSQGLAKDLVNDCISRQAALGALGERPLLWTNDNYYVLGERNQYDSDRLAIETLPSTQPPKEIPKRVLWSGWKGYRDTRYKCPNCEKPVRNDDAYCHRCGQRLMFPKISFTDYIPGKKQDVIVRWDDEG